MWHFREGRAKTENLSYVRLRYVFFLFFAFNARGESDG